jgi:hypothetical protein
LQLCEYFSLQLDESTDISDVAQLCVFIRMIFELELEQELDEVSWLLDLAFLTDITSKLNEVNLELQGKDRNISSMISVVNAFQNGLHI